MSTVDDIAPLLSTDVIICPVDAKGRQVVKNVRKQKYLQLGEQESFLLERLDGTTTYGSIKRSFEQHFSESLSCEEIDDFVKMVKDEGLISGNAQESDERSGEKSDRNHNLRESFASLFKKIVAAARKQNPYYFRVTLFDPDRALNWLEPRTRWLFSRELAVAATIGFLLALLITWMNRNVLISQFSTHFGWRTLALAWFTTILVTVCHEFGHGLACKRYGGEVREMGALWIFFTPCLFCNVSDAWLIPSKWRRLLVSMAGTYIDLLIWIAAVFVWRVTSTETAVNYMAWIIVSACGLRVAFNSNPLMRLDGYYALSDFLEIPNLRKRARARWMEYVRWILWGAKKPAKAPRGRTLLIYGVTSWFFVVGLLSLLFFNFTGFLQSTFGIAGFIAGATLFLSLSKRYFKGSLGEDFKDMLSNRKNRVFFFVAITLVILLIPMHDRSSGNFHVRPAVRWEVRAPVDGFLRHIAVDQGSQVSQGAVIAKLEVPQLESQLKCKLAEIREVEALLKKLQAGPRIEELIEQRERVARAVHWRDLAETDLERAKLSYDEQLAGLDLRIAKAKSDFDYRSTIFQQSQDLYERGGLAGQQLLSEKSQLQVAEAELYQSQAAKRARMAEGVMQHESELARREKELADTEAVLALLEAGTHPDEIEAQRARLVRLQEEHAHLCELDQKQVILAPADGTITTPRLREKLGQFLVKGAELCFVENQSKLEAEIAVPEENARVLDIGQPVTLKPRSLPFQRLNATVARIAPSASGQVDASGKELSVQRTVTVYCSVENGVGDLRSGMTGFGRIYHHWRPMGWVAFTRVLQFLRTEFWI